MLPLMLFAASSLVLAPQTSMKCADTGANIATAQTQPVRGPAGVSAVLKVSSADDHSKNAHLCNAEYQLLVMSAAGGTPTVVDLLTTDDDYYRSLSLRLDGFSKNGKRILGIFSESGKHPSTTLFDYHTADGKVQLVDVSKQFAHIAAAKCGPTFAVIGTTESGAIVVELDSPTQCASNGRWLLNSTSSKPQRLPQNASILTLYKFKADAP